MRLLSVLAVQGSYNLMYSAVKNWGADQKRFSHGLVMDSAVHILDEILYTTSSKEVKVLSAHGVVFEGVDYDVKIQSVLSCGNGDVTAQCRFSRLLNLEDRLTFVFENAEVICGLEPNDSVWVRQGNKRTSYTGPFDSKNRTACNINQAIHCNWVD